MSEYTNYFPDVPPLGCINDVLVVVNPSEHNIKTSGRAQQSRMTEFQSDAGRYVINAAKPLEKLLSGYDVYQIVGYCVRDYKGAELGHACLTGCRFATPEEIEHYYKVGDEESTIKQLKAHNKRLKELAEKTKMEHAQLKNELDRVRREFKTDLRT